VNAGVNPHFFGGMSLVAGARHLSGLFYFVVFLLFDRAAGFLPPRP
jgi:hypothetical protein